MRRKLGPVSPSFEAAVEALRDSVVEHIPAGRIYLLGATDRGPIFGSLISGVGIARSNTGILVVRVARDGRWTSLGGDW